MKFSDLAGLSIISTLFMVFIAVVFTLPVYIGWNWGVLAAFPNAGLGELGFFNAFFLSLILNVVAQAHKSTIEVKK